MKNDYKNTLFGCTAVIRTVSFVRFFTGILCLASLNAAIAQNITPGPGWSDSYSVNGKCYCDSTFDHGIGPVLVDTPVGSMTVRQVCDAIGPGPGKQGNPVYNDIQCGNGPANNAADETLCPGRVDLGSAGCQIIGPRWDLSVLTTDPIEPPVAGSGWQFIEHRASGERLKANKFGNNLGTADLSRGGPNVRWEVIPGDGDTFFLVHEASNLYLASSNGQSLTTSTSLNNAAKWRVLEDNSNWIRIIHDASGKRLFASANGAVSLSAAGENSPDTQWRFVDAP